MRSTFPSVTLARWRRCVVAVAIPDLVEKLVEPRGQEWRSQEDCREVPADERLRGDRASCVAECLDAVSRACWYALRCARCGIAWRECSRRTLRRRLASSHCLLH